MIVQVGHSTECISALQHCLHSNSNNSLASEYDSRSHLNELGIKF